MKKLELSQLEIIEGGVFCNAVTVADGVLAVGSLGAYGASLAYPTIVLITPVGVGILAVAGVTLAGLSLYCAFS